MRYIKAFFFFVAISFLFFSCTSYFNSSSRAKLHDDTFMKISIDKALATYGLSSGDWPESTWWKDFNDTQLNECIELGIVNNPSLKIAKKKIIETEQYAYMKRAKLFPKLAAFMRVFWVHLPKNLFIENSESNLSSSFFKNSIALTQMGLELDYTLDFWKKNYLGYKSALGEVQATKALEKESEILITSAIASSYVQIQAEMISLEIMREILARRERILKLKQMRKEHHLDSQITVMEAKAIVDHLSMLLVALEEKVDIEKNVLKQLMGRFPDDTLNLHLNHTLFDYEVRVPKDIGIDLLARRPDIIAEIFKVKSLGYKVGVAEREFFPNVDLSLLGGFQSLNINSLFKSSSISGGLLPSFVAPLFMGGALKSNLKEKVAQYEQAVYEYNQRVLIASKNVVNAVNKLGSLSTQLDLQRASIEKTHEVYELTYRKYKHGLESLIGVLTQDEHYLWQRLREVMLQKEKLLVNVQLIKELGGGYGGKE